MRVVVLTIVMLLLISCGKDGQEKEANYKIFEQDGYRTIVNKNNPAQGKLKLEKKLALEITIPDSLSSQILPYFSLDYLDMDIHGNFYILTPPKSKIHKFNPQGKYELSFGHSGQGPGEFNNCHHYTINKDTIMIYNAEKSCLIKYSDKGNLINEMKFDRLHFNSIHILKKNYLLALNTLTNVGENFFRIKYFILADNTGKKIKVLLNKSKKVDMTKYDPTEGLEYTIMNDNLYLAKASVKEFQIDKYDSDGKKLLEIKRNYASIFYTPEEQENLKKEYIYNIPGVKIKFDVRCKQAIKEIVSDKDSRLWVKVATRDTGKKDSLYKYEIYDQDGIYQYCYKTNEYFRLIKDKLVVLEYNKIKVYDY